MRTWREVRNFAWHRQQADATTTAWSIPSVDGSR